MQIAAKNNNRQLRFTLQMREKAIGTCLCEMLYKLFDKIFLYHIVKTGNV